MFFNQLKEQESQTPAMWHQLLNLAKLIGWLSVGAGPPCCLLGSGRSGPASDSHAALTLTHPFLMNISCGTKWAVCACRYRMTIVISQHIHPLVLTVQ